MLRKIGLLIFWTVSIFWLNLIVPTFILPFLFILYMMWNNKEVIQFKPNQEFSTKDENGKSAPWYNNYIVHASGMVVYFHGFFAYMFYDYQFYPVRDKGNVFIDVFVKVLWGCGTSTLCVMVGRNFAETLKEKNIDFILKKKIIPYIKLTLMIIPINILLWFGLTKFYPELDNNPALHHLFFRFFHLWFFIYLVGYYILTYFMVKFLSLDFLISIIKIIKKNLGLCPDLFLFLITALFLLTSSFKGVVGNPAGLNSIDPFIFLNFFVMFLFGTLTAELKNYSISYGKFLAYVVGTILSLLFLYSVYFAPTDPNTESAKWFLIAIASSVFCVTQQNVIISMCCIFFSKRNAILDFMRPASLMMFCFNLPVVVLLQVWFKKTDLSIPVKIILINYFTWFIFILLSVLFKIGSKKLIKKH